MDMQVMQEKFLRYRAESGSQTTQNPLPLQLFRLPLINTTRAFLMRLPVIQTPTLMKTLHIPKHTLQSRPNSHFQNRLGWLTSRPIEKAHILIQNQIRLSHKMIRLRNQRFLPPMFLNKALKLLLGNHIFPPISQSLLGIILSRHNQDLKTFPSSRLQARNVFVHIFLPI